MLYVILLAGHNLQSRFGQGAGDSVDYNTLAVSLFSGHGFAFAAPTAYRPPLYPALVALVYLVTGKENFLALRIVQAGLGGLVVFVVGVIAYRLTRSRQIGALAALLIAFNPLCLFFTGEILTEILFSAILILIFYRVAVLPRARAEIAILGIVLGFATLTRPTAQTLLPICLIAIVVNHRRTIGRWAPTQLISSMAVLILAFGAIVTPWMVRNTLLFGQFTSLTTNNGVNLLLGISRQGLEGIGAADLAFLDRIPEQTEPDEVRWDQEQSALAMGMIETDPLRYARICVHKWLHFFSPVMSDSHPLKFRLVSITATLPLLLGTLLWPFVCWKRRTLEARTAYVLLSSAVLLFSIAHSLYITNVRFRIPVAEPVFAIFAADVFMRAIVALNARTFRLKWLEPDPSPQRDVNFQG